MISNLFKKSRALNSLNKEYEKLRPIYGTSNYETYLKNYFSPTYSKAQGIDNKINGLFIRSLEEMEELPFEIDDLEDLE